MYSKSSWGGPVDPFILIKFTDVGKDLSDDPVVSLVMFEWRDEELIGVPGNPEINVCGQQEVAKNYCNATDLGEYILAPNATDLSNNVILTKAVHLKKSQPIKYPIPKTGYFCVVTGQFTAEKYEALVEFRNAYGELPASQIPKLPFYGGITILYAVVLAFWAFLYYQHRADICELRIHPSVSVFVC
jgi:hypothetical protein